MFGVLKKAVTDFTLKAKGLFASSESQIYVKDLRKVMTYTDGRKCKYPKNYDQIVESGKIIEAKNSEGETIYKLLYGKTDTDGRKPSFELTLVKETDDRSYFTIDSLVNRKKTRMLSIMMATINHLSFQKSILKNIFQFLKLTKLMILLN